MNDFGFIYFAKAGDLIKVGCTTNTKARMRDLTKETGVLHYLIDTLPVTYMHRWERWLHIFLAQYHHHGEYFNMSENVIPTALESLKIEVAANPYGLAIVIPENREWFYARRGSRNPNCLRMYIGGFDWNNIPDEYQAVSQELVDLFWSGASNTLENEYRNTLK